MPLWLSIVAALISALIIAAIGYGGKRLTEFMGPEFGLGFLFCGFCVFCCYHLGKWMERKGWDD